jgi:cytochrome P450
MATRARIQGFDDPDFSPMAAATAAFGDVPDLWQQLRALQLQGPVLPGEFRRLFAPNGDPSLAAHPHFMVLGYREVSEVYADAETFSNERARENNHKLAFGRTLTAMDPPDHPKYRRAFQTAFMPKILSGWREDIVRPIISGLIDRLVDATRAEMVEDFCLPYPFQIIYRQLDLPDDDIETFLRLAMAQPMFATHFDRAREAGEKLGAYLSGLIAERRASTADDLISIIARIEQKDGELLPEAVVLPFLRHLLNAGGDTTFRSTGSLLVGLLSDRDQWEAVRADRTLVGHAVDEALRWEGPVVSTTRQTTRAVMLGDVDIPEGAILHVVQGAANHDEAFFEDPDRFDIHRSRHHRNFAFASGPHSCLGNHLARMEMTEALNLLLDRLPGMRLDPDMPAPRIAGFNFRGPDRLHIRLG